MRALRQNEASSGEGGTHRLQGQKRTRFNRGIPEPQASRNKGTNGEESEAGVVAIDTLRGRNLAPLFELLTRCDPVDWLLERMGWASRSSWAVQVAR